MAKYETQQNKRCLQLVFRVKKKIIESQDGTAVSWKSKLHDKPQRKAAAEQVSAVIKTSAFLLAFVGCFYSNGIHTDH